jgi:hypothetical protein
MQDRFDRARNDVRTAWERDHDREGADRHRDEERSWSRSPEAAGRREGYGQYAREDRGYRDDYDYGGPTYGRPRPAYRSDGGEAYRQDTWDASRQGREGAYRAFGRDDDRLAGERRDVAGRAGSASRARDHDYDPDYLHWREQQMNRFDRDYDDWRSERREKFSTEFDTWRSQRNAIVENVADGGTGSQKDIKSE